MSGCARLALVVAAALVLAGCSGDGSPAGGDRDRAAVDALASKPPDELVAGVRAAFEGAPYAEVETTVGQRPLRVTVGDDASRFDWTNGDETVATQLLVGRHHCVNDVALPELVTYFESTARRTREVRVEGGPWVCATGKRRDRALVRSLEEHLPTLDSLGEAAHGGSQGVAGDHQTWLTPIVEQVDGQWVVHLRGDYDPSSTGRKWISTQAWIDAGGRPVRVVEEQPDGQVRAWDITYPADVGDHLEVPEDPGTYALRPVDGSAG